VVVNWTSNVSGGSGWQVANLPTGSYTARYDANNPYGKLILPNPTGSPVIIRTDTGEPILLGGTTPFYSNRGIVPTGCAGWS
jgi:hypothetical protein